MLSAPAINHDLAQEVLTDALRREVGPGKPLSRPGLAELTGIEERTIAAWLAGGACPNLDRLMRLLAVLPPRFADALLAPAGLGGVRLLTGEAGSLEINRQAAGLVALIGEHMADGRIDHREEALQEASMRELARAIDAWLARRAGRRGAA